MDYNHLIDSFISFLIDPHEIKTHPEFSNSIYWVKNKEVIAEIKISKNFWLYYKIWSEISDQFGLDYNETQLVIKNWLEKNHGLEELTPKRRLTRVVW